MTEQDFTQNEGEGLADFFTDIIQQFTERAPIDATEEDIKQWQDSHTIKLLNRLGCNLHTKEELDLYFKIFRAWHPLNMLSQFLNTETAPFKEATPEILVSMWDGRDMLLPLVEQMKDSLVAELEERGICPPYMKRHNDKKN